MEIEINEIDVIALARMLQVIVDNSLMFFDLQYKVLNLGDVA
jgi:hypothetical protein